jgi:predicted DNA-binding transcriptional regulator YafY
MSEPEVNEAEFNKAQRIVKVSALRGSPIEGDSCANCYYYLEPGADLAFCWHEKLHIMVGSQWWCHYWEMVEE